jgi:thiamine pyrophosphokinase
VKTLLLAAGLLRVDESVRRIAADAALVIAADGGVRHALTLRLTPDLIVGDFDSARAADLEPFADVARERHPPDKGQLDLELALTAAWDRGATEVAVLGAFGGRLDQSLATLMIAARERRSGRRISLHGDGADVHLLVAGDALPLEVPSGTTFSLLALAGDAEVDVASARYPLEAAQLPYGVGLGVSNVALSDTRVRVHRGEVAVVTERPLPVGSARERIWGSKSDAIAEGLETIDPDLAELTMGVAYDRVFERPGLDLKTRELLAIAHLTALGAGGQLETHVWGALNCGAEPVEIRETVIHAAMFVGFPRALDAMRVVADVLRRRS